MKIKWILALIMMIASVCVAQGLFDEPQAETRPAETRPEVDESILRPQPKPKEVKPEVDATLKIYRILEKLRKLFEYIDSDDYTVKEKIAYWKKHNRKLYVEFRTSKDREIGFNIDSITRDAKSVYVHISDPFTKGFMIKDAYHDISGFGRMYLKGISKGIRVRTKDVGVGDIIKYRFSVTFLYERLKTSRYYRRYTMEPYMVKTGKKYEWKYKEVRSENPTSFNINRLWKTRPSIKHGIVFERDISIASQTLDKLIVIFELKRPKIVDFRGEKKRKAINILSSKFNLIINNCCL